jgi:flagellar biosynthetic protein FliR
MHLSLVHIFGAILTIGVRLSGMMLFAPFFGSVAIPARVKAMLVLSLTALLYPMLSATMPELSISQWPALVLGELLIGIAVGIATNIVFDGVQMAGSILSVQMGYSLVNILDPQTEVDSTVVALFHQTLVMLIFLRRWPTASTTSRHPRSTSVPSSPPPWYKAVQPSSPLASKLPHPCSPQLCSPTSRWPF